MMKRTICLWIVLLFFAISACNSDEGESDDNETNTEMTDTAGEDTQADESDQSEPEEDRFDAVKIKAGADYYAHFENEQGLTADMRAEGDNIFLMLGLPEAERMISLNGSYERGNEFTVKGVSDTNGNQANYKGRITEDYGLEIKDENNGKSYKFTQNYAGGLPFKAYTFKETTDTDAGSPEDKMFLLLPAEGAEDLKKIILQHYFDKAQGNPNDLLKAHHEALVELYESDGMGGFWSRDISSELLFNDKGIVSYGINAYSYTGGAHGNGAGVFIVYDLKADKQIKLKDVFSASEIKQLSELVYEQIKKDREMSDEEMQAEYDLPLAVTENFYFTPKGMHFFYNAYELTSYAMGPDAVFFSFDFLKKNFNSKLINRLSR